MCLNTNGIKTNYNFLNKVTSRYDIIVLQETMSLKTATIKQAFKNNRNLKFFNKKALKTHKKGRGSGGLSFIVKNNLKCNVDYPSDRIGILRLGNLAIFNVYLPCHKHNNFDQEALYKKEIDIIMKHYNELKNNNYKIIIMGDFNVDNYNRDNNSGYIDHFDTLMAQLKLHSADVEIDQFINYTFKTAEKWLDHVLVDEGMFDNIDVLIKEDYTSNSDHFPMVIETSYKEHSRLNTLSVKKQIDKLSDSVLNNIAFRSNFQANMNVEILKLEDLIANTTLENNNHQTNINQIVAQFYKSINDSIAKAQTLRDTTVLYGYAKSNSWWSDRAQLLHDEKDALNVIINKSKSILERIKIIKRQLDGIKNDWEKRGIRGLLTKQNKNYYHERTNFWKALKKSNQVKCEVDLTTNELKEEFSKLFNTKLIYSQDDAKLKLEIDAIVKKNENANHNIVVMTRPELKEVIEQLGNNKAVGQSGLSNEVLKLCCRKYESDINTYDTNYRMLDIILYIINYMCAYKVFPDNFNTSVMYALVKDNTKSSSDMNNIRGISVSDVLTNVFEKLILKKINEVCPNIKTQFGFTKKASCGHV